jgi:hypothetical protein
MYGFPAFIVADIFSQCHSLIANRAEDFSLSGLHLSSAKT